MPRKASERVIPGRGAISVNDPATPVPSGWVRTLLSNVGRLESGHTPSRKHPEWWDGDINWIGIADARVNHGGWITQTAQTTNEDGLANSAARLLPKGTVCLSRTASVGYCTIMGKPMATSQDFVNWVCSDALDPEFLMNAFQAEGEHLLKFGKGSTHTTIYFPEVLAFNIALPPLNEQKRIVAKIDALTEKSREAREALDEVPDLLDKLRQSILAVAFRGDLTARWRERNPDVEPASVLLDRIRKERRARWEEAELAKMEAKGKPPKDDKWKAKYKEPEAVDTEGLPELPEGWCWASVEELASFIRNGISTRPSEEGPLPILRISSVRPMTLRYSERKFLPRAEEYDPYLLENGDLLFTRYNGNRDLVGVAAVVENLSEDLVHPDKLIRVKVPSHLVEPWWLAAASAAGKTKQHLYRASKSAAGQIGISGSDLKSAPVPLAPIEEQRAVVALVRQAIRGEADVGAEVESLAELGQQADASILAKAFRGELVPQDPNDEPASVLLERIRAEREAAGAKKAKKRTRKAAK